MFVSLFLLSFNYLTAQVYDKKEGGGKPDHSKKPLGSRRDRHDHIGKGMIGLDAFRRLVNDRRFDRLPMLLETPKTEGRKPKCTDLDPLDVANLATMRSLLRRGGPRTHCSEARLARTSPRTPRPET